ncbi:MAG: helix-turn-helix transcriptional regulator [Bacteroidota bacterium]|nr:helix-turn-helix transcriptional regulator [Bacteroidota bacterium]MDP4214836.1 helix-turn-helix transcriptional regulator [Bacteroidota bacterium]MDP4247824.1 helix-turn-helix transcriptional regulator [Bacteroidota bacterium]MDP4253138.1 helix-turn-helix transcriptional regulator [Bacteroidota bacterium]MDP4259034.1 helix-turn-helix transcriptional regulator [Bacteroidota bacterium]
MNSPKVRSITREFGRIVRSVRTEKDLSIRHLEAVSGIDNSKICKIEAGKVNVSLSTLVCLAHGLGVHPSELLKGDFDYI